MMNQSTHSLLLPARENKVGPAGLGGASRPRARPKIFKIFCEVLLMQKLSNFKHGLVEIQT
jgi:hypothetical protein